MKLLIRSALTVLAISSVAACGSSDEDASRIVIGNSNGIFSPNGIQYQDPYVIQVTDIDGIGAPNSIVSIKVKPLYYMTGYYAHPLEDDTIDDTETEWKIKISEVCQAEDINNNGVIDAGEDVNQSGGLEPTNSVTISAHPSLEPTLLLGANELVTDESGFGYFSLTYPKSEATWVAVKITATTSVSGSEDSAELSVHLPGLLDDYQDLDVDPPGKLSPYGTTVDDPNTPGTVESCVIVSLL